MVAIRTPSKDGARGEMFGIVASFPSHFELHYIEGFKTLDSMVAVEVSCLCAYSERRGVGRWEVEAYDAVR